MCPTSQLFVMFVMISVIVTVVIVINLMYFKNYIMAPPCGEEASINLIHHNPWLVHLEFYKEGAPQRLRCAGTLVGRRHVVTAAHCVNMDLFDELVVRLGEYDLSTTIDCVNGVCADDVQRISVANVYIPKNYDGENYDIAVLVLAGEAPYTDFIRPICLPTGNTGNDVIYSAAGWGETTKSHVYSRVKKIIPLPHWTEEKCRQVYNQKLPKNVICAGGQEGVDTCRGDSGGPLTLNRGKIELWGVTSSGNVHCGTEGSPGIYTSVKYHLGFIEDVMRAS